jgi:hypothetical protein
MERPALRLTTAARKALARATGSIRDYQPVVTVQWSDGGRWWRDQPDGSKKSGDLPPGWDVGFYKREEVPESSIVSIDGIDFVFNQGPISMQLDGKFLDFSDEKFIVADSAI